MIFNIENSYNYGRVISLLIACTSIVNQLLKGWMSIKIILTFLLWITHTRTSCVNEEKLNLSWKWFKRIWMLVQTLYTRMVTNISGFRTPSNKGNLQTITACMKYKSLYFYHCSLYWTPKIANIWHLSSFRIFNNIPGAKSGYKKSGTD